MKRQYTLLFTLLTIGLAVGANAGMKRWGTGDVINGRDLTNNFDNVSHYSNKYISTNVNYTDNTSKLYASVPVTNAAGKTLVANYTGYISATNNDATLFYLNCGRWVSQDDGGSTWTTFFSSKMMGSLVTTLSSHKMASGSVSFTLDAGYALCGTQFNLWDGGATPFTNELKIEEVP